MLNNSYTLITTHTTSNFHLTQFAHLFEPIIITVYEKVVIDVLLGMREGSENLNKKQPRELSKEEAE